MKAHSRRLGGGLSHPVNAVPADYDRGASSLVFLLWLLVRQWLFDALPRPCYGWRRFWLRLFGASIGRNVLIRQGVRVEFPWRLAIGEGSEVGEDARIYNPAPISIGQGCVISQLAHLCSAGHDPDDPDFVLTLSPIVIEDGCWVAADAFVGPGVTMHERAVLGARSSTFGDLPAGQIYVGSPARVLRARMPAARVSLEGQEAQAGE